jgi:hypothetical protein
MTEDTPEPSTSGSTSATNYTPSAATTQQFKVDFPVLAASDDLFKLTASVRSNTVASLTEVGRLMISYTKLSDSHAAYDAKYFDSQDENNNLRAQVDMLQDQLNNALANPANQTTQVLQLTAQLTAANVEKERLYGILENGGSSQRRLPLNTQTPTPSMAGMTDPNSLTS